MEQHKMQEADERYHRNNTEVANAFIQKNIPPKHQGLHEREPFLNSLPLYRGGRRLWILTKCRELGKRFLAPWGYLGKVPMMFTFVSASSARTTMLPAFIPLAYQCVCIDVRSPA